MLPLALMLMLMPGDPTRAKELFRSCSGCHNTETDERKMGPSLRSLFGKVTLRNGRRVDPENVRSIILEGFNGMPAFPYAFLDSELDALLAYLQTPKGKPMVKTQS